MQERYRFGNYFAVLIDLLGHRELYRRIERIPNEDSPDRAEVEKNVVSFIRAIERLNQQVTDFLHGADSYKSPLPWPENKASFRRKMHTTRCRVQRFSDGILIYVPLLADPSHFPIGSAYLAMACGCSVMLNSLACGAPVRGGIAVGGGIEIENVGLFGPVIGLAHKAESELAQFPRIAVDASVARYLRAHATLRPVNNLEKQYLQAMGAHCTSMLKEDHDGQMFLDYLGHIVSAEIEDVSVTTLLERARSFVRQSLAAYKKAADTKLYDRYRMLAKYWDIDV